jgi:DMSO/TMAO reductase YedYZ molybdopterin-dependent catalytic subunit
MRSTNDLPGYNPVPVLSHTTSVLRSGVMRADPTTRRDFLVASCAGVAAAALSPLTGLANTQPPIADGRLVRTLPLGDPRRRDDPPLHRLLGSGLDARLFTDLSNLAIGDTITPVERFFVRTACPAKAIGAAAWTIACAGRIRRPLALRADEISRAAAPAGPHLLECSGNTNPNNYGLMSVAEWDGMPMTALLDRLQPRPGPYRVLVAGVDDDGPSRTSTPGASWIFSRDDLERTGAFLATRMNGATLAPHHGAPVRLVVPGWYACTSIKWVDHIQLVADDVEATPQMREFAARTHQPAGAVLARDFAPPVIDVAAMPIRVEQWDVRGRPAYRIVGITWGGPAPAASLQIRFRSGGEWIDVSDFPRPRGTATWSLWTHRWQPAEPGRYDIVLRVKDPAIRTRRLDLFFYVRTVDVTEV